MDVIFVLIAVVAAFAIIWLVFSRKQKTEKPVVYVCTRCGEHHCSCSQVDEIKPAGKD